MMMKPFGVIWLMVPLLWLNPYQGNAQEQDDVLWKKARRIHDESLVVDAHAHAQMFGAPDPHALDLGHPTENSQIDFVTMKQGGLDAVFMAMPLRGEADRDNPVKGILDSIERIRQQVSQYSDLAEIALSPSDVQRIHKSGKRAVLLSTEFPGHLEGNIENVELYFRQGVRSFTVVSDQLLRSDTGEHADGLSAFGRDVIKEMNRLGMVIDISHAEDPQQLAVVRESRAPVIASHSCVRALYGKPRNIPDEILKAIAQQGGVVAITFSSYHLSKVFDEQTRKAEVDYEAAKARLEKQLGGNEVELEAKLNELRSRLFPKRASIELLIDHIDHAVKIAGINHVGIGSDYGGNNIPIGLETAEDLPKITYHLLKRGYRDEDIKKILGGNLLRVLEEVQKIST
jgi:membrane dipeptidase